MRVSVCVGDYATTPYCITSLAIRVYCMEELCFCLRENAFLLDMSLLDEGLVDWIAKECGLKELAKALYPMVRKQGSLSEFVILILEYVGLYDKEAVSQVEAVLKEGAGLSGIEKRKNQIDCLVQKKKYPAAIHRYDELLTRWQEEAGMGVEMPQNKVKAQILHNKGVALAGIMEYGAAAECFRQAYEISESMESYQAYLAAKRMELDESAYLSLVAGLPDSFEQSLLLEKRVDQVKEGIKEQVGYQRLEELKEWRFSGDKSKYYQELDRIARTLKEQYRNSVNE